jgi:hypothetical protein
MPLHTTLSLGARASRSLFLAAIELSQLLKEERAGRPRSQGRMRRDNR